MKLLSNTGDKFNELVFEHRNKDYGAYVIRKTYSDSVIKAFLITFSSVALLLGSAVMANNLGKRAEVVVIPKTEMTTDTFIMDLADLKKPALPKDPVPQTQAAAAAPSTDLPTTVVDDPAVVTHSTDIENPTNGQGDPNATGTSQTSTATTSNTTAIGNSTTTVTTPSVATEFVICSEMPEYEGGMNALVRFLASNMMYPEAAKLVGKEGTVYISFIVDENGNVGGAKVVKGIGYGCDEEALRVVNKIPKWKKAGRNGNQPVRVRFNLPISFKLR